MRTFWCAMVLSLMAYGQGPGMRPKPGPKDYPANVQAPSMTIAAAALSKQEVRNAFAVDLNKGYVVFEVAIYPDRDATPSITPEDFMLSVSGEKALVRPAEPPVIARAIQERNAPKPPRQHPVEVVGGTEIGYASGGYDPVTGQKRKGTWVTGTSVGVGTGVQSPPTPPKGPYSDNDRDRMEAELADKSLPIGAVNGPVAGYVYFPLSKTKAKYELKYMGQNGSVTLVVPAPPAK